MKACAASPLSLDSHKNNFRIYCAGIQISARACNPPPQFPQQFVSSPTSASNRSLMRPSIQPLYLCAHPPPPQETDESHVWNAHKNLLNKRSFLPSHQIQQWEQNLERFNMDLFRMRCYLASLQGGELPNPKSLLAFASRPTKTTLGRLGIFSVSSFHALVRAHETVKG